MVSLVVIVALQFIDRHFIDTGIAAPDQYARVALVWLTFIGFAIAVRAALNIRVDLIDAHLPPKVTIRSRDGIRCADDASCSRSWCRGAGASSRSARIRMLLGTVFTAAVPAAGVFIACILMLLYVGLRLIARLLRPRTARPRGSIDVLALLFVAFLLALLIGFDVGFSMIFSAWLGILAKPGRGDRHGDDAAVDDLRRRQLCAGAGAAVHPRRRADERGRAHHAPDRLGDGAGRSPQGQPRARFDHHQLRAWRACRARRSPTRSRPASR